MGTDLDQFWIRSGPDWDQFWTRLGPVLDQIWARSGPLLDPLLVPFWVTFEPGLGPAGIDRDRRVAEKPMNYCRFQGEATVVRYRIDKKRARSGSRSGSLPGPLLACLLYTSDAADE